MPFHNSYHFVPVKKGNRSADLSVEDFRNGRSEISHDRYLLAGKSGRIVCRLTAESPFVVGATRHAGEPAQVDQFELEPGIPAIPGSSLRGLISGVVEAASNSALRVLEDRGYSFRRRADQGEALSAIGMIVKKEDKGQSSYWLRPLTWPTLPRNETKLSPDYSGIFKIVNLRVYIGDRNSIRDTRFSYTTWRADKPVFYGMRLQDPGKLLAEEKYLYRKNRFLLGQRPLDGANPEIKLWDEIPEEKRSHYKRGIVRVLGCKDRSAIPNTKYHELFIPYPKEAENWTLAPLARDVIERFYELADERTESMEHDVNVKESELLPFHPAGTHRNNSAAEGRKFRLKHGDLVYFSARGGRVTEIALSSIWRGRVEDQQGRRQTTWEFFRHVDSEVLPFTSERKVITAAERLFGFVEHVPQQRAGESQGGLALCGRLRFSNGLLEPSDGTLNVPAKKSKYYEGPVVLRILGSPKPPCPSFYFKRGAANNTFIKKAELNATQHQPQGRKFYLHNQSSGQGHPLWETTKPRESLKQKVRVTPVSSGTQFWFHIDFENLTQSEFDLLHYALRPNQEFRHKLGMGKSLGLGQVRIDPVGVFLVNRTSRYSADGLMAKRFTRAWILSGENLASWPKHYEFERQAEANVASIGKFVPEPDIAKALQLLGNPVLAHPVHTPTMNQDRYAEEEAFAWFVANERSPSPVCLQPIHNGTATVPTLPDQPVRADSGQRSRRGQRYGASSR